jgi:hypothetical protein
MNLDGVRFVPEFPVFRHRVSRHRVFRPKLSVAIPEGAQFKLLQ